VSNENTIQDKKCPLCDRLLEMKEYHLALNKLEKQVESRYKKEDEIRKKQLDEKIKSLNEQYESDKNKVHEFYTKQISENKLDSEKKQTESEKRIKIQYDSLLKNLEKQSKDLEKRLKKQYDDGITQTKKQFKQSEKDYLSSHKRQLKEKELAIKELEISKKRNKLDAYEKAKSDFNVQLNKKENEIKEQEKIIQRANEKAEELQTRLSKTQSELKGEIGEENLMESLQCAFPNDRFLRQTRGTSSADIYQTVVLKEKKLDIKIAYDNKENTKVKSSDIEKAKKYANENNIKYVIIVSTDIPKSYAPNGIYGLKDGILIVNPRILVEVATRCRDNIIEISRIKKGSKDRDTKESKLFDYMISSEFSSLIKTVYETNEKMRKLQDKEVRLHQTLWKDRSKLRNELIRAYMDIESSVESITQKETVSKEILVESA